MSIAADEKGAAEAAHYTDSALIEKYLEIKTLVELREKELSEKLKPLRDGMELVKNTLLARLNERGADNTKTESGTAYKSKILDCKVVDRQAFLSYCVDNWSSFGSDMLNIKAVTDPVKQAMAEGAIPPGLETSTTIRINIRRS